MIIEVSQVFPHTPSKVKKPTAARPEGQEAHINSIALKAKSPQQHALKGQKLLAQGIALGIMAISDAPCKGKSFKIHLIKIENPLRYVKLLPLQGVLLSHKTKPRALPWAMSFCPFRACCF